MASTPENIACDLERIAGLSRTGDCRLAASQLNRCLIHVQSLLSCATSLDSATLKSCAYSLETLTMMQQRCDWVAFADIIEYELLPLWRRLFP